MTRSRKIVYRLLQAALILFLAGFWFHTAEFEASIAAKYSPQYFKAAIGVTLGGLIGGLFFLWFLFRRQQVTLRRGKVAVPLWAKLALTIAVLLAVAIPSEIVLRNIHRRQAGRHSSEYHPYLQAVPEPTGDSYMQINRWGFRGENIEKEKPPGAYRIFVLGGSTVYCDRVKFEQSHCRILEKLLQAAYPDVKIEVQNAGMHWHTSEHSLIKFLTDIQDFQPDAIVVFHGINDLCRSFSPPSYARPGYHDDYRHYYGAVARMVESNGGDRPLIDSFALNTLTSFVSRYWFSDFRNPVHVPERPVSEWKSLPAFRRNLRSLSDTVQSQGIALVVASQPSFYKTEMSQEELARLELTNSICRDIEFRPDRNSLIAGMQAFNAASRQIADQTGALFVDLAAAVPKTTEFFVDDVHYLPAGNRVVGETLARAIIESGIIESPDKAKSAEAQ